MIDIIWQSIIVGAIGGFAISAGAARMYHAPDIMGMGAFRTLGELNASKGDPVSHFSFGAGFLFSSAATAVATGSLTQDVMQRIIPNFAVAGLGLYKKQAVETSMKNPLLMGISGAIVGVFVFLTLNTAASVVPVELAQVATGILSPASNLMIKYVMPLLFLWAAFDAGKIVGMTALLLVGLLQLISGNGLPGAVLGILLGYTIQENGIKDRTSQGLLLAVSVIIILIAYFRNFHETVFTALGF